MGCNRGLSVSLLLVHVIEVRTGVFMWSWCNFEFEVCLSGYCSNSLVLLILIRSCDATVATFKFLPRSTGLLDLFFIGVVGLSLFHFFLEIVCVPTFGL